MSTTCSNDVPFVVEKSSVTYRLGKGSGRLTIDLAKVLGELSAVLPSKAQVTKYVGKLDIYSLCETCWGKASAKWAIDSNGTQKASDYASAAAKATAQGLFFHANEASFALDTRVNLDVVRSTTVHEMVHWSVAGSTQGFQGLASGTDTIIGLSSWSWDEVLTDYLARQCYKRLKYGDYKTNYGNYSDFLDKASEAAVEKTGFAAKRMKGDLARIFGFDAAMSENTYKAWLGSTYKNKLFEELCYRYVKGNHASGAGGDCPANFKAFAEKTMFTFAGKISLSEATY